MLWSMGIRVGWRMFTEMRTPMAISARMFKMVMASVADPRDPLDGVARGNRPNPGQRITRERRYVLAGRSSGQQPGDRPLTPLRPVTGRPIPLLQLLAREAPLNAQSLARASRLQLDSI